MRRTAVAVVVVVVLAVSCNWAAPGFGPDRNSYNSQESTISPTSVVRLRVHWTARTAGTQPARFPIVSASGVHVVDNTRLYSFDKETGAELWRYTAPAGNTMGPAIDVGQDKVLVGSGPWGGADTPAYLATKLMRATGQLSPEDYEDGMVVSWRDHSYLLERYNRSGSDTSLPVELTYEHVDFVYPSQHWSARVFVAQPGLTTPPSPTLGYYVYQAGMGPIMGAGGGQTGTGNALRGYPVTTAPTLTCTTGTATNLACPTWSTPALDGTTATSPVLAAQGKMVYTGTNAGSLYGIKGAPVANTTQPGTILWQAPVGAAVQQPPALANGVLYAPTADGDLVAVDEATGAVLWSGVTGSSIDVQPAVAGGVVFTGSANGVVSAFNAAGCGGASTCQPLWSFDTGAAAITGAPALVFAQLYVGTADGRLVAFNLPAT